MIIITSEVLIEAQHWQSALVLAQSHVEASRQEEGCISHRYLLSPEKEYCIFFYEEWKDRQAIDHHFKQGYSLEISRNFRKWAINEVVINFHQVIDKPEKQEP